MKHKILMTLALLLTAVTGAWAITDPNSVYWDNQTWAGWAENVTTHTVGDITITCSGNAKAYESTSSGEPLALQAGANDAITFTSNGKPFASIAIMTDDELNVAGWTYNSSTWSYEWSGTPSTSVTLSGCNIKADAITFTFGTAEAPITVEWNASSKTGTFTMPDYNVLLTPIYAAATVYGSDGQTEKSAYASLKEAFLAAQNGDIIKLDGDVTVTSATDLSTSNRASADPVQFTIDFNGHVLDGYTLMTPFIVTNHEGDEIRFIDSSEGETGGLKGLVGGTKNSIVFASGRFNFGEGSTADYIENQWNTLVTEYGWTIAEGKKFVDLEGAPDANGFMVGIGLADYDISFKAANANTIESGKASVTIDGAAATLTEGKVTGVKMGQQVKMTAAQGYKFRKVEAKKGEAPATPEGPTLAQTLTTANMTVKVYYIYTDMNNTCEFLSNGDGTYTFQSGTGLVGGNSQKAKALVVENGKLVFKQNFYETLSKLWNQVGFSVTFDTSENTYSIWKGSNETINATLSKVEVNGTQIALTQQ